MQKNKIRLPHGTFYKTDHILRIQLCAFFGDFADNDAVFVKKNNGRRHPVVFSIRNDDCLAELIHIGDG
jgi:hypothetical protein